MASLYKRGQTWWVAYYRNGKKVRESLRTVSKRQALREKQAIEAKLFEEGSRAPVEKDPPIEIFWSKYQSWARKNHGVRTLERKTDFWRQFTDFTQAGHLGDVRAKDAEAFKDSRIEAGNSPTTVNNAITALKAIYNRARRMGEYTGHNPFDDVEKFKTDWASPEFHTEDELNRLFDEAHKISRATAWVVLLGGWAGLRRREIANARWEWFHWGDKPVLRPRHFEGFAIKDREERAIPMARKVHDALYPHHQQRGFVFEANSQNRGRNRYRYDPRTSLLSALRNAGLTTKDPYQRLRHTFGSLHAQKGKSLFKISRWMGHSTVKVTERHYAGLMAYDEDIDAF
jgi:integrase